MRSTLWYQNLGRFSISANTRRWHTMYVIYLALHYDDVIMTTMASQITSLTVVYSNVYSDADQRKHQSSASLAFVWGIHRDRWIPRTKGQLRRKCFHLMTSSCNRCHVDKRNGTRVNRASPHLVCFWCNTYYVKFLETVRQRSFHSYTSWRVPLRVYVLLSIPRKILIMEWGIPVKVAIVNNIATFHTVTFTSNFNLYASAQIICICICMYIYIYICVCVYIYV